MNAIGRGIGISLSLLAGSWIIVGAGGWYILAAVVPFACAAALTAGEVARLHIDNRVLMLEIEHKARLLAPPKNREE